MAGISVTAANGPGKRGSIAVEKGTNHLGVRARTKGLSMSKLISSLAMTVAAASMLGIGAVPKPAAAQTLNTIMNTVAGIGQQILYGNYQHNQQPANTVVGYTQNGGTLYGDGRIVMPNGQTFYPNSNGRYSSGQYVYYNPNANPNSYTYDYNRTGQFDRTHRHGMGHAYANGHDKHGDSKHGNNNHGGNNQGGNNH